MSASSLTIQRERCIDWHESSRLEWLETNGRGGFAMGTVSGARTRRYHGLLIGSVRPPSERQVLLAKLEEEVRFGDSTFLLDANQYPGALHPRGFEHLVQFRLDPFPTWTYALGELTLVKRLFLPRGQQTVVVQYRADKPCELTVRPMLAMRDYHALSRASSARMPKAEVLASSTDLRGIAFRSQDAPMVRLFHSGAAFVPEERWYYDIELPEEGERGFDMREDIASAGSFTIALSNGVPGYVAATIEPIGAFDSQQLSLAEAAEVARREPSTSSDLRAALVAVADSFVATRADGSITIMAGYPWFMDWGRDAMISLPGLLLSRGHLEPAREVLASFLRHEKDGLIPNRFPDRGEEPEYNTGDATLWLIIAAHAYVEASGDTTFLRTTLYPAAEKILRAHRAGAPHDIKVDPSDGLLSVGKEGTQLTWMDARVGDRIATPRHGKPVEINALYYNALRIAFGWAKRLENVGSAASYEQQADDVARSFERAFWNEDRACLYDVIAPQGPVSLLRPNQIFALSLPFPLLSPERREKVLTAVQTHLLTPYGLRTLAPGEPGYAGTYQGDSASRDAVYHQGTVWPWLMGPFVDAYRRVHGSTEEAEAQIRAWLTPLRNHLENGCLGTIAEIFDADAPHLARGAPSQAWSVAELLRVVSRTT